MVLGPYLRLYGGAAFRRNTFWRRPSTNCERPSRSTALG
jgi:hypothetical protein